MVHEASAVVAGCMAEGVEQGKTLDAILAEKLTTTPDGWLLPKWNARDDISSQSPEHALFVAAIGNELARRGKISPLATVKVPDPVIPAKAAARGPVKVKPPSPARVKRVAKAIAEMPSDAPAAIELVVEREMPRAIETAVRNIGQVIIAEIQQRLSRVDFRPVVEEALVSLPKLAALEHLVSLDELAPPEVKRAADKWVKAGLEEFRRRGRELVGCPANSLSESDAGSHTPPNRAASRASSLSSTAKAKHSPNGRAKRASTASGSASE